MKTQMAETSVAAFHSIPIKAGLQRREVELMALFRNCDQQYTREQLAARLGWKEAAVCGRVNSLVTKKALEEVDGGVTLSGRSAKLVRLPRAPQKELFQ